MALSPLLKDIDANNLAAKIKLGFMACEIAPDVIEKVPVAKIAVNLKALIVGKIAIPANVWLTYIRLSCWSYVDTEHFSEFVAAFRPWRLDGSSVSLGRQRI
jgi:hypothetical protein